MTHPHLHHYINTRHEFDWLMHLWLRDKLRLIIERRVRHLERTGEL